jgi:hypothetical protein
MGRTLASAFASHPYGKAIPALRLSHLLTLRSECSPSHGFPSLTGLSPARSIFWHTPIWPRHSHPWTPLRSDEYRRSSPGVPHP